MGKFGITVWAVIIIWIVTAIIIQIVLRAAHDPRSGYPPEFGVVIVTGVTFILYGLFGVVIGLVTLIFSRTIGGGILAGTGIGAVIGFVACILNTGSL